jgi:hypothetical protein
MSKSSSLGVCGTVENIEAKLDEAIFNRKVTERIVSFSEGVVQGCEAMIERVESLLLESTSRCNLICNRVSSLESLLTSMENQL